MTAELKLLEPWQQALADFYFGEILRNIACERARKEAEAAQASYRQQRQQWHAYEGSLLGD